jgi:hypothetical protein
MDVATVEDLHADARDPFELILGEGYGVKMAFDHGTGRQGEFPDAGELIGREARVLHDVSFKFLIEIDLEQVLMDGDLVAVAEGDVLGELVAVDQDGGLSGSSDSMFHSPVIWGTMLALRGLTRMSGRWMPQVASEPMVISSSSNREIRQDCFAFFALTSTLMGETSSATE